MSHYVGDADSCAVYREDKRTARKEHTCSACKETIKPGNKYINVFIVFDGERDTIKRCARCQTLHLHLRGLGEDPSEFWPDEKLNCGEEYENHWGKPPPEEIAALAFATSEEAQVLLEKADEARRKEREERDKKWREKYGQKTEESEVT